MKFWNWRKTREKNSQKIFSGKEKSLDNRNRAEVSGGNQKVIIFDSGTLISFSMAGLLPELERLGKVFGGKFVIPKKVKEEAVDRPIKSKRFELEAMKIQNLIDKKVLVLPDLLDVKHADVKRESERLMDIANSTMYTKKRDVTLIQFGEASCLALSKILTQKGIDNIIAVDERTTRILSEKPENLRRIMEKKLHMPVKARTKNYKEFEGFRFVRSAELIYVAYKKGLVSLKGNDVLDALLYAVKFKGAAISGDEIREIKKIG